MVTNFGYKDLSQGPVCVGCQDQGLIWNLIRNFAIFIAPFSAFKTQRFGIFITTFLQKTIFFANVYQSPIHSLIIALDLYCFIKLKADISCLVDKSIATPLTANYRKLFHTTTIFFGHENYNLWFCDFQRDQTQLSLSLGD